MNKTVSSKLKSNLKPLPLSRLIQRGVAKEDVNTLRLAVQTGYLHTAQFITKLEPKEVTKLKEQIKGRRNKPAEVDSSQPVIPERVSFLVDSAKVNGNRVQLHTNGVTAIVDHVLYITMQHRHPGADVYLSADYDWAMFSQGQQTVAAVAILDE